MSLVCCRGALVRVEVRPLLPQWQHNLLYIGNLANDGNGRVYSRASTITSFARVPMNAICDIGPRMTAWRCHLGGGGKARTTGVGPSAITSTSPQTYYKIITISLNYKTQFQPLTSLHSFTIHQPSITIHFTSSIHILHFPLQISLYK